jgi:hypothetical protein
MAGPLKNQLDKTFTVFRQHHQRATIGFTAQKLPPVSLLLWWSLAKNKTSAIQKMH